MDPVSKNGRAHFYAPVKIVGEWRIDTFWFNIAILWIMSLLLYTMLLGDLIRRMIKQIERLKYRKK